MNEIRVLTPLLLTDISVVVGTFGSDDWAQRGLNRALSTFLEQTRVPEVIWVHADTLAQARNRGADLAACSWLVFLDADDMLDRQFCESMEKGLFVGPEVLQVSVRGFRDHGEYGIEWIEDEPVFHPKKRALIDQNYLIIGSPITKDLFLEVGGFNELPCLEDWDLWLRAERARAQFGECQDAVYLINDDHQRNEGEQIKVAKQIRKKYR